MSIKFSVLLPTKERLELLKTAIWSVLQQNYDNWEIIVSDNYSQECDIKEYINSLNDKRIVYVRTKEPINVTENWNNSLNYATGDYIIMLGDDDALLPNYFSRCLEVIENFNNPDVLHYGGYVCAFPDVIEQKKQGFLHAVAKDISYFQKIDGPRLLSRGFREYITQQLVDTQIVVPINSQYSMYSKEMVTKMKKFGDFFQPPFPDFYTTTMSFMAADTFVAIPEDLILLGVTKKSYGYYFFNKKEKEGMDKLHHESNFRDEASDYVKKYFCNLSEQEDGELATMNLIVENYPEKKYLKLGVESFLKRAIQLAFREYDLKDAWKIYLTTILPKLNFRLILESRNLIKSTLEHKAKNINSFDGLEDLKYSTVQEIYKALENGENIVSKLK